MIIQVPRNLMKIIHSNTLFLGKERKHFHFPSQKDFGCFTTFDVRIKGLPVDKYSKQAKLSRTKPRANLTQLSGSEQICLDCLGVRPCKQNGPMLGFSLIR